MNASICTYSHAGNDKGMLQQQRELQMMETVYLTIVTGSESRVSSRTVSTYIYMHIYGSCMCFPPLMRVWNCIGCSVWAKQLQQLSGFAEYNHLCIQSDAQCFVVITKRRI